VEVQAKKAPSYNGYYTRLSSEIQGFDSPRSRQIKSLKRRKLAVQQFSSSMVGMVQWLRSPTVTRRMLGSIPAAHPNRLEKQNDCVSTDQKHMNESPLHCLMFYRNRI
jgi:hypothetical protein